MNYEEYFYTKRARDYEEKILNSPTIYAYEIYKTYAAIYARMAKDSQGQCRSATRSKTSCMFVPCIEYKGDLDCPFLTEYEIE